MRIESLLQIAITALFFAALSSCVGPVRDIADLPTPVHVDQAYALGPGDKIRLSLYGDESFSGEFTVTDVGTVSLPLIGTQQASGKTIDELRYDIITLLADGYYRDPRLSAEVVAYRPFYIFGEVNKPGDYPYVAGLTLGKAIAIAGGYTYRASTGTLSIQRDGTGEALRVKSDQSIIIGPGDTIEILERYF